MAELSESTRHAAVCGEIIQILGREYPRPVSVKTIVNAMYGGDMLTMEFRVNQAKFVARHIKAGWLSGGRGVFEAYWQISRQSKQHGAFARAGLGETDGSGRQAEQQTDRRRRRDALIPSCALLAVSKFLHEGGSFMDWRTPARKMYFGDHMLPGTIAQKLGIRLEYVSRLVAADSRYKSEKIYRARQSENRRRTKEFCVVQAKFTHARLHARETRRPAHRACLAEFR
jgi:hypothetical protein